MDNGVAMPGRNTIVELIAEPKGDLVRPGLYDDSSWEQILAILEERGFECSADPEIVEPKEATAEKPPGNRFQRLITGERCVSSRGVSSVTR
jgi:hypothetical protein